MLCDLWKERESFNHRLFPNKAKLHPASFQPFEDSCFNYDKDETTSEIHFAILDHFLKPYVQRSVLVLFLHLSFFYVFSIEIHTKVISFLTSVNRNSAFNGILTIVLCLNITQINLRSCSCFTDWFNMLIDRLMWFIVTLKCESLCQNAVLGKARTIKM